MKNKPNFFFDNRGFPNWGGGGSAAWEFFPHNPVFLSKRVPYSDMHNFLKLKINFGVSAKNILPFDFDNMRETRST